MSIENTIDIVQILCEIISEQTDAMNQFGEITGKYHPLIITGQATKEDVKKCSNIVKNINSSVKRANDLRNLYKSVLNGNERLYDFSRSITGVEKE